MTIQATVIGALAAACSLLATCPAWAVDGEILIDQAKINAGGAAPGDAPGFPATLSRPGRYKLTGNLTVPPGAIGIEVTRSNVTIDFNGFTLGSNPPGQLSIAVYAEASTAMGLQVANGTITGVQAYGVYSNAPFTVVENMRIIGTAHAGSCGVCGSGIQARIRNNTIAYMGDGIRICRECLIEQNVVTGNTERGVYITGGLVLGNLIAGNASYGLDSFGPIPGYGNNLLFGNNGGGAQAVNAVQLHPNVCVPACP